MATFCDVTSCSALMVGTTFDTATTTLVTECITSAEDEIRRTLANRYDVSTDYFQTTTAVPPAVRKICKWLSVGYAYEALARGGKEAYERADRYIKNAKDELTAIIEYKSSLVDTTGSLIPEGLSGLALRSTTENYHDTFDEGRELRWRIDPDKLEDISDEKS